MSETLVPPVTPTPEKKAPKPKAPEVEPVVRARKGKFQHKDEYKDYEWRTGRAKSWQARLIYAQLRDVPSDGDILIGQMESPALAKAVVEDHNGWLD